MSEHIESKDVRDKVQLELKKRQMTRNSGDKGTRAVCSDIVHLFLYSSSLNSIFLRDTIAASSMGRYVNITHGIVKQMSLLLQNAMEHLIL